MSNLKVKRLIVLILIPFHSLLAFTQNTYNLTIETLPLKVIGAKKSISDIEDLALKNSLRKQIYLNPTWKRLIQNKQMAIGIVDLSDANNFKYAGLNDNFMMYAASLPKIAILISSMDAIDKGELKDSNEIREDLRLMISRSNNHASTRMIDRVGYAKIEKVLRDPKINLYNEKLGGGLWVGKRYAAAGKRYPEPMKGLSHAATTRQVCSFYFQMAMGNLISFDTSRQMLEIMKKPDLHHKFVNTLDKIAPEAAVYRKSGSWRNFHSDSALVWGETRKYIIVVLLEYEQGEQLIRDIVVPLEKVLLKTPFYSI